MVENLPANAGDAGDTGLIYGLGRFPRRRKWLPTPVFLLGNHINRGARQAIVQGVTKNWTQLSACTHTYTHTHTHTHTEMMVEKWGTEDLMHKEATTSSVVLEDGVISSHIHTLKEKCSALQLSNGQWHVD